MKARFVFLCAVAAAAVLAACGGGGGGGGTPPTSPPATPTVSPTGPASGNLTFSTSATSAPLPSTVGATGTISIPSGQGTVTYTFSTAPPSPGPAGILARTRAASATSNTGVVYVTMTAQTAVTINGVPGFSATPSGSGPPAGSEFYVAYYGQQTGQSPAAQSAAWVSSSSTGATLSSGTLTIPATTSPVFTLTTGQSVYFVLYYGYYIPPINNLGCVGVQGNSAQRQLVGVQPPTVGSTWAYTGTLTDAIARSSPCPIPTASSAASVTVDVSVASSPGLSGGFVDEHSVESDAYATNTTQVTTDAIVNGTSESSETSTDLSGNTVVTTYASPYLTYAPSSTVTNSAPATVNTTFVDGTTYARTYGASGAYTEIDTLAGVSTTNTIATNATGAASYNVYNGYNGSTIGFTMSAPANGSILFTVNSGGTPQTLTVPQWFQTGTSLYSDSTTVTTGAALDSSCVNSVNVLGSGRATEYVRTISTLDPALGYTETETIDSYVVPNYKGSTTVGPVCVVIGDTQKLYYDFLFDTPYLVYVSGDGQPVQTDTLSETYYFSSAPVGESRVRPASAAMADGNIALQASGFAFRRAVERAQRIETFERAVSQGKFKGVVR